MVKVFKYSTKNLFEFVSLLNKNTYLFFLDLEIKYFDGLLNQLNALFNIVETRTIKIHDEICLVIIGLLNYQELQRLINKLDSMDIGEFEISEYHNKKEISKLKYSQIYKSNKSIYVNKDEKIIQLYNF